MKIDRDEVMKYAEKNGMGLMQAKENVMRLKMREAILAAKTIEDLKEVLIAIVNRL